MFLYTLKQSYIQLFIFECGIDSTYVHTHTHTNLYTENNKGAVIAEKKIFSTNNKSFNIQNFLKCQKC